MWRIVCFSFALFHLKVYGINDEAIQAFSLAFCKVSDYLTSSLWYHQIDPVIGFFVVPGSGLLLGLGVCHFLSAFRTHWV